MQYDVKTTVRPELKKEVTLIPIRHASNAFRQHFGRYRTFTLKTGLKTTNFSCWSVRGAGNAGNAGSICWAMIAHA